MNKFRLLWAKIWMRFSGLGIFGRISTRLASLYAPPYYGRFHLSSLCKNRSYVSAAATVYHTNFSIDESVFIDDRVLIYKEKNHIGKIELLKGVKIFRNCILQNGNGGTIRIDENTSIQANCFLSAHLSPIEIGKNVGIAPNCSFFSYDHTFEPDKLMIQQPLKTKGGVIIEDDVWIGCNVCVLDGVKIGAGSIISAGSTVMKSIPEGAIASGIPARVISWRKDVD